MLTGLSQTLRDSQPLGKYSSVDKCPVDGLSRHNSKPRSLLCCGSKVPSKGENTRGIVQSGSDRSGLKGGHLSPSYMIPQPE